MAVLLWPAAEAHPGGAILPPDAAVRPYVDGREAVRSGHYAKGIKDLSRALETGHTSVVERLGSSRNFVERYDPYYWLGVAYMETGDEARARENLVKSKTAGLIQRWPEYSDLVSRLTTLDQREAARRAPTPTAAIPSPTPSPVPVLPSPQITEPPTTPVGFPVEPTPTGHDELEAALAALSSGNLDGADAALRQLRTKSPRSVEAELLETVILGSRYLLGGRRDAALLAQAKRHLAEYRKRGGSRKAQEVWISPALASALER